MGNSYNFQKYSHNLLSREKGSVSIKKGAPVRIALVYPNHYSVGMSNLGFQTVYRLFNEHPEVRCERVFLPEIYIKDDIRTLESCEQIDRFDVVGFSISYELDLLNVIKILVKSRIPVLSRDRTEKDPLVIAGGVVAGLNPSPLLPFVDGLLVGEGEGAVFQMSDALFMFRQEKHSREDRLRVLREIEGVFIPRFNSSVKRRIVSSLNEYPTYTSIVSPLSHFGEMFVTELGRGCTRNCLFCAAQKIYRPCRFHSIESILETVLTRNPGAKRVGLEGADLSDYPDLENLCRILLNRNYEVSLSSIRADRVTKNLVDILEMGKVRSITIAPETGSERIRKQIGKGISNKVLTKAVGLFADSSIEVLKLYFLIGLPNERNEDIESIIELVHMLTDIFKKNNKKKRIRLSINAFVPKAFTEFQWAPMAEEKDLIRKRKQIIHGLKREKGVNIIPKSSRDEVLQAILSLGDESVGLVIMDMVKKQIPWKRAMKENNINYEQFINIERNHTEFLPWDFIKSEISKENLWRRYRKYLKYAEMF